MNKFMMQNNPKNLASLINIISHVEIPILACTKEHVTKLRNNMDCIALRDLAYVIGHDQIGIAHT